MFKVVRIICSVPLRPDLGEQWTDDLIVWHFTEILMLDTYRFGEPADIDVKVEEQEEG